MSVIPNTPLSNTLLSLANKLEQHHAAQVKKIKKWQASIRTSKSRGLDTFALYYEPLEGDVICKKASSR